VPAYAPATNGSPVATDTRPYAIAYGPSGSLLAVANYGAADVSVFTANVLTGGLTPAAGSPETTGNGPVALAFNPGGTLLATANLADGTVSVFTVDGSTGALSAVPGSPYGTGVEPRAVAFSPNGSLLAVANSADGTVSLFAVNGDGSLTPVAGSPFLTGGEPVALAFSPDGSTLAVADERGGSLDLFAVADGGLTATPESPVPVGRAPVAVAYSPNGALLAVADSLDNAVSILSVGAGGSIAPVSGSPFATDTQPLAVAFNKTGSVLATANGLANDVSLYAVDGSGNLTPLPGSPFPAGDRPHGITLSPGGGGVIAVANTSDNDVSLLAPSAPTATVAAPAPGASYTLGQTARSSFSCQESLFGPGISTCLDGAGAASGALLDTTTPGAHTYAVTATSLDGQTATTRVSYTVIGVTPTAIVAPTITESNPSGDPITGPVTAGDQLYCQDGSWTALPSSTAYQWIRDGEAIPGATSAAYTVMPFDEGSVVACVITATNVAGSTTAEPPAITVPVPVITGCPALSGTVVGARLGGLRLGQTTAQTRRSLRQARVALSRNLASFCASPSPIDVALASGALLKQLKLSQRTALSGRAVLALTASPLYTLNGIVAGMSYTFAQQRIPGAVVYSFGTTSVAFAPHQAGGSGVVVAVSGIVTDVGVALPQLARVPKVALPLVKALVALQ
jgi:6-phosphogluconolactonase (cycloisomerase 2 family)